MIHFTITPSETDTTSGTAHCPCGASVDLDFSKEEATQEQIVSFGKDHAFCVEPQKEEEEHTS